MDTLKRKVGPESQVTLHFSITLADGTEAISTFEEGPLTCILGEGTMAESLEQCLYGLVEGSDEIFLLAGDEAFGPASEDNVQPIPRADFPADMPLSPGQVVAFTTPAGDEIAGIIQSLTDAEALVDFNHPLSGQTVSFRVKILEVGHSAK
jgi:FKBP-type peptidyl-prolyl cis-trans isomerase SlpA